MSPVLPGTRRKALSTLFSLRPALRAGSLTALLDPVCFAALDRDLITSGLAHDSLYGGDEATLERIEAPVLLPLERAQMKTWSELLRRAGFRHAGLLCVSDAPLDELRRHWKKWLSVHIPEEEALVLFRFYDARIALAFAATLGPADAQAFFGPNEALVMQAPEGWVWLEPAVPAKATRVGAGNWYQVTPVQMTAMTEVADQAFRDRFARYMAACWPEVIAQRTDGDMTALVDRSLAALDAIGAPHGERDIVKMALVLMLAPGVESDPEELASARRYPRAGWTNLLLGTAFSQFNDEGRRLANQRVRAWEDFE